MFTFLYYVMPICIVGLCLFLILLLLGSQSDHLKLLRFTLPLSILITMIGVTLSTWTPLSPLPYYQQHLHIQKVNEQYKVAENYLNGLVNKGFLSLNVTVKKHVNHQHFAVAQKKIKRIDDREKRKALMNKHNDYLAIYENDLGDKMLQQIDFAHLSVTEYGRLTAQDYDNVRYQIKQHIQDPQIEKYFLKSIQKLQKEHDKIYSE